jgi:hypothetical protein
LPVVLKLQHRAPNLILPAVDSDQARPASFDDMTMFEDGDNRMPRVSRAGCLLSVLIAIATTGSEAKVLRSKDTAADVLVFKDADALRRFGKLTGSAVENASAIEPLLACRVPQGTNVEVLGSGYRTAFIKVIDGLAYGCQGTVSLNGVRER